MKNRLVIVFLLFAIQFLNAQVVIGPTSSNPTIKSSAGLEVTNFNNKGFLMPVVDIVDITNSSTPVPNPANGLLVYNKGAANLPGIYFWKNGKWNLTADANNTTSYALILSSGTQTKLNGAALGSYQNLLNANQNLFFNDIVGLTFDATKGIALPGNGAYSITVCLNISTLATNEIANSGITGSSGTNTLYVHQYSVVLKDPSDMTKTYGEVVDVNVVSTSGNRKHLVYCTFAVTNSGSAPIYLFPSIAYGNYPPNGNGGNYYNNLPAGKNGEITIDAIKMDVQKVPLVQ